MGLHDRDYYWKQLDKQTGKRSNVLDFTMGAYLRKFGDKRQPRHDPGYARTNKRRIVMVFVFIFTLSGFLVLPFVPSKAFSSAFGRIPALHDVLSSKGVVRYPHQPKR